MPKGSDFLKGIIENLKRAAITVLLEFFALAMIPVVLIAIGWLQLSLFVHWFTEFWQWIIVGYFIAVIIEAFRL
jgi:hypothetical protein